MAELTKLTPEEHDTITQMVKSPGWRVLMEKLVLPELLLVSRHIDNVTAQDRDTQLYRGAKLTLTRVMQTVYRWARLPNPLEEHHQALLASLRTYTEDYAPQDPDASIPPYAVLPPRRVSRPVL